MIQPVAGTSTEDLRREAIRLLAEAIDTPPMELKAEVDRVERAVVALRDTLIDTLRSTPGADVRRALDRVNVALSLVVGLEYPMGGLQSKLLEDARTVLQMPLASER